MADEISVTLDRWLWIYFLGWLEARRNPAETSQLTTVVAAIAQAVGPHG